METGDFQMTSPIPQAASSCTIGTGSSPDPSMQVSSDKDADERTERAPSPTPHSSSNAPASRETLQVEGDGPRERIQEERNYDPQEPVDDFDYADLEERFLNERMRISKREDEVIAKWTELMNYFGRWVTTPSDRDEERAIKRLRTRVFHVQNTEAELEKKRQHYLRVVQAFENALKLLNQH